MRSVNLRILCASGFKLRRHFNQSKCERSIMTQHFFLPHCMIGAHNTDYWEDLLLRLNALRESPSLNLVEDFIVKNRELQKTIYDAAEAVEDSQLIDQSYGKYLALAKQLNESETACECPSLRNLALEATKWGIDIKNVMEVVIQAVSETTTLFPADRPSIPLLKSGEENVVTLSRHQIFCLLAHMFLCTLVRTPLNKYWVDFYVWLSASNKPSLAYLAALTLYFQEFATKSSSVKEQPVIFRRYGLQDCGIPNWSSLDKPVCDVTVYQGLRIGDMDGEVELDFANKDIGYGKTGTQEELLFGMSPEMCVAVLFTETMKDGEAVVIQGAQRVGEYKGYGLNVEFQGLFAESRNWLNRTVVAIDALEIDPDLEHRESLLLQLKDENLLRELNKAYTGFSAVSSAVEKTCISTGAWGCGAFGGDKDIKSAIQVMAASASGVCLSYNSFTDHAFAETFRSAVEHMKAHQICVGDIWKKLKEYENYLETLDSSVSVPSSFWVWLVGCL